MTKSSDIIQDILNLKGSNKVNKTASASKLESFTSQLLKIAEEMEEEEGEEKEEEEEEGKEEKKKSSEKPSDEAKDGEAEDVVEAALAELNKEANSKQRGGNVTNIDYDRLAASMLKIAVDGTGVYGLDKDMTSSPKADSGVAANAAEAQNNKKTTVENTEDRDLGVAGPVDGQKNQAPQPFGGGEGKLIPSDEKGVSAGEIKQAMARMSDEDIVTYHKLATVGFEVAADVLSDEAVEKHAQQMILEEAHRVKVAEAYNYLASRSRRY